jgi:hypothetical protein
MNVSNVDAGKQTFDLMTLGEQASCSLTGDSGAEVAAVLVQSGQDQEAQARSERQAEEKRLSQLEAAQVDCLMQQADAVRSAGQLRALGQMAAGAGTLTGSLVGLDQGGSDGALMAEGYRGGGEVIQGSLNLVAAEYDFAAKTAEADGARAGNASRSSERRIEELSAAARESGDVARDALQAASSLVQAEQGANQATLYLRG